MGHPGWHIECSVAPLSTQVIPLIIHGARILHPFLTMRMRLPSLSFLHRAILLPTGFTMALLVTIKSKMQKWSKSLGNFCPPARLKLRAYEPMVIRHMLATTHSSSSFEAMMRLWITVKHKPMSANYGGAPSTQAPPRAS